jgi:hypothetical protein
MEAALLEQYCEFLHLMGHRVIRTQSALWIDIRPWVFQPAPPFRFADIHHGELNDVFKSGKALACRWFNEPDDLAAKGEAGNATVLYLARQPYDLSRLSKNIRHNTRRGLKRTEVRRVNFDDAMARLAYPIYADDTQRLGLLKGKKRLTQRWATWVKALRGAPGLEFWSAWHETSLVAFSVVIQTPWGTEFVLNRSLHSALNLYPNNALIYSITKGALDGGASVVSLGLSAFTGDIEGLHRFKTSMGFDGFALREQQTWHPVIRPFGPLLKQQRLRDAYRLVTRMAR